LYIYSTGDPARATEWASGGIRPDPNDPILKLDNVILTPHALCWTHQCFAGIGAADVKAVIDVQRARAAPRVQQGALGDRALAPENGGSPRPIRAVGTGSAHSWADLACIAKLARS
jgi:hypothetical protein